MNGVGVIFVKIDETNEGEMKYLNINVSDSEIERNPDAVKLHSDAGGVLEYIRLDSCGDVISRQAVLNATVKKNSIWNKITNAKGENLEEIVSQLPPAKSQDSKSEWEHDHEILKAYSDGVNEVLDKIIERISLEKLGYPPSAEYYKAIIKVLQIINEYKTEESEE